MLKCMNCSKPINAVNVKFCSQCGSSLTESFQGNGTPIKSAQPFWKRDIGIWVLTALLTLMFYMFFLTIYGGNKLSTNEISSAVFWPGIAGTYIWRKRKKNGWVGFGAGVVCGVVAVFTLTVMASVIRQS